MGQRAKTPGRDRQRCEAICAAIERAQHLSGNDAVKDALMNAKKYALIALKAAEAKIAGGE